YSPIYISYEIERIFQKSENILAGLSARFDNGIHRVFSSGLLITVTARKQRAGRHPRHVASLSNLIEPAACDIFELQSGKRFVCSGRILIGQGVTPQRFLGLRTS